MNRIVRHIAVVLLFLGLLGGGVLIYAQQVQQPLAAPVAQATGTFADPAFQQVWDYTDKAVQDAVVTDRSWTWGPTAGFTAFEPYTEAANGQHEVQYFDKSRMEINDPGGDRNSQWFVTNGLLVVEMITGRIATGNATSNQTVAAQIPVAGDPSASVNAPSYAALDKIASLDNDNRATDRTGQIVDQALDKDANIVSSAKLKEYAGTVAYAVYEPTLGHNIPNVFWTFMNQSGLVYSNGQYVNGKVMDWVFAMGYPITEPYWISINVGGAERWVLMQAFQRRILTYSPQNSASFQVEMGNVGQSYYDWRYNQQGATLPTATTVSATATGTIVPVPTTVASLSLGPTSGGHNTTIEVKGAGYPSYAGINVGVQLPGSNDQRGLTTAAADAGGNFTAYISLPDEYSAEVIVTVYASAEGGAITATADYTINHNPSLALQPPETTNNGVISISGSGFPANSQITLSAEEVKGGPLAKSINVTSDSNGQFEVTYTLQGKASAGGLYTIVAEGPNDIKAEAPTTLKIIQQPEVSVQPNRGPAGVSVIFSGSKWQANRLLEITLEGQGGQTLLPLSPVVTDGAGNFASQVLIPQDYAGQSEVTLWASDGTSRITVKAPYTIVAAASPPTSVPVVPTATPILPASPTSTQPALASPTRPAVATPTATTVAAGSPEIAVNPNPAAVGQPVTIAGRGFTAGSTVSIYVVKETELTPTPGSPAVPSPTPITTALVDAQGTFTAKIELDPSLRGAGTVAIIAAAGGGEAATTTLTVLGTAGSTNAKLAR